MRTIITTIALLGLAACTAETETGDNEVRAADISVQAAGVGHDFDAGTQLTSCERHQSRAETSRGTGAG